MSLPPEAVTDWLLRISIEGSLLILVVLGLRRVFGRHLGPRWRIALWTLVGLKLLLPASLPFFPGIGEWVAFDKADPAPAEISAAEPSGTVAVPLTDFSPAFETAPAADSLPATATSEAATPTNTIGVQAWLIATWLGGALLLLTVMMFRQWRFTRTAAAQTCRDPELRGMLRSAAREVGLRRPVGVVLTPAGTTPAVFGVFQPRVLVPIDWKQRFDATELRHILLHELEHVRFGDVFWNWMAAALNALHWFNPLAWIARTQFQSDRELRCDAGTLARLESADRIAYGRTLLNVQENFHAAPAIAGLAPCVRHHSTLRQRIAMITHPTTRKTWLNVLLLAAVAALFCFSFGAAQADGERDGAQAREGARDGDRPREGTRDGDQVREGARDGDKPREGARDGDQPREGTRDGDQPREGTRDGDKPREGTRDGDKPREGTRDGDKPREGARDGDQPREGTRDGDKPREGARDGEMRRGGEGTSDRPGEIRLTVERDGVILGDRKYRSMADFRAALAKLDGKSAALAARGDVPVSTIKAVIDALSDQEIVDVKFSTADGSAREGMRDGDGERREGARDGDRPREGARDGDSPREGGEREGARDSGSSRESSPDMNRQLSQLTRIYGAYDKNSDDKVTFEEWLAMKSGEMPRDRREREQGWFDEADANGDDGLTLQEWQDWKLSQGSPEGSRSRDGARDGDQPRESARDGDQPRESARDGDRPREGSRDGESSREGARDGDGGRSREGARDGDR